MPTLTAAEPTQAVARILTAAKKRRGLSFTQLGAITGLGRATVVRYLEGSRDLPTSALYSICYALGLKPADVIREADETLGE